MVVAVTRATRHQKRLSIRLALLLLIAAGLVGWSAGVVAVYYALRAYDGPPVARVEQAFGAATPVNLRLPEKPETPPPNGPKP